MHLSNRHAGHRPVLGTLVGSALVVAAVVAAGPASGTGHRWTVGLDDVPVQVSATYPALTITSDTNLLNISLPAEFDWTPSDLNAPAPSVVWSIEHAGAIVGAAADPPAPDTGPLDGFGATASIDFSTLPTDPPVGTGYLLNVHAVWSPFAPANAGDVVDLDIGFTVTADVDGGNQPVDLRFANATTEARTYLVQLDGPVAGGDTVHVSTANTGWDWTTGPDTDQPWGSRAQAYGGIGVGATDAMHPTQALEGPFSISTPDPTLLIAPVNDVIYAGATRLALDVGSRDAPASGPVVTALVNVDTSFAAGSASKLTATTAPAITGAAVFGRTLHASGGTWAPVSSGNWALGSTTRTYQWYRGTTSIAGATSADHVVTLADVGRDLTVRVGATIPGYVHTVVTTAAVTGRPASAPVATKRSTVSGTFKVGRTLTAHKGTWTLAPTSYRYQWLDGGKSISGAVASTYRIRAAKRGHVLSCRVTAVTPGHTPGVSVTTGHKVK